MSPFLIDDVSRELSPSPSPSQGKAYSRSPGKGVSGSKNIPSLLVDIFTMPCVVMREKDASSLINKKSIPETSTVYQFYGCKWHSCPCLGSGSSSKYNTLRIENQLKSQGYNVVSVWECPFTIYHLFIGIILLYNEKRNYTKYYPRLQNNFKTNGEQLI